MDFNYNIFENFTEKNHKPKVKTLTVHFGYVLKYLLLRSDTVQERGVYLYLIKISKSKPTDY